MANINVMDYNTGQVESKPTEDVTVAQVQGLTMLNVTPPQFDVVIRLPAANTMVKVGALSQDALLSATAKRANFTALSTLPAHGITDAPADAVTNYNTVTTLLGLLVSAVNTANAKQNEIATKFNQLLAWLSANNIPAVNALRTVGAAA